MLFIDGLLSSVPCGRVADPPTTKKCTSSEALRRFLRGPALQVKCSREGADCRGGTIVCKATISPRLCLQVLCMSSGVNTRRMQMANRKLDKQK